MKLTKCPACRDEGKLETGTVHCSFTGVYLYTTYEICRHWEYHPEYLKMLFKPIKEWNDFMFKRGSGGE